MFGPGLLGVTACEAVLERQSVSPSAILILIAKAVCTSDGLHVTLDLVPVRLDITHVGIATTSSTVDDRVHLRADREHTLSFVTAAVHVTTAAIFVGKILNSILELRCKPIETVESIVAVIATISVFATVTTVVDDVDLPIEAASSILKAHYRAAKVVVLAIAKDAGVAAKLSGRDRGQSHEN